MIRAPSFCHGNPEMRQPLWYVELGRGAGNDSFGCPLG